MADLHYSIIIQSPRPMVWDVMLSPDTYREWAATFEPGSHYEGSWDQGSDIEFLGSESETGEVGGMFAQVVENRQHEYVSVAHLGEIRGSERVPYPGDTPVLENYTFADISDGTHLSIDIIGFPDAYEDMMNGLWPKALDKLKELAESWETDIDVAKRGPE